MPRIKIAYKKSSINIHRRRAFGKVIKAFFYLVLSLLLLNSPTFFSLQATFQSARLPKITTEEALALQPETGPIATQTISITNPHKGYQYNYKGNLHAHSCNGSGGS